MLPAFDNPVLDEDATPNTIALIGNGYDIHYGLNTKYSDFYDFLYNLNRFRDSTFENFKSEYLKTDYMIDRKLNYVLCENVFNE